MEVKRLGKSGAVVSDNNVRRLGGDGACMRLVWLGSDKKHGMGP